LSPACRYFRTLAFTVTFLAQAVSALAIFKVPSSPTRDQSKNPGARPRGFSL